MKEKLRKIGEQHLRYNLEKWVNKGTFYILNNIGENVTLMQLMYILVNMIHAIIIVGYWIFDSNYKEEFHLTR